MKLLMLGWEFPPLHSGGLGVATKNIAEALTENGVNVCFALPKFVYTQWKEKGSDHPPFEVVSHQPNFEVVKIASTLQTPYATVTEYEEFYRQMIEEGNVSTLYGNNLFAEIERYAIEMEHLAKQREFSLVHAHDWLTFPAAMRVKKQQDKPYVAHIHATEIDRTGGDVNQEIYDRERKGLEAADKIIAVSEYTKQILHKHYGLKHKDISVVHNGTEKNDKGFRWIDPRFKEKKRVLFLGRLTLQKGPDWFVKIAKKVIEKDHNVEFLMAGTGNMLPDILKEVAACGLSNHVIPLGFLNEAQREEAFTHTDLYVMPSVSEPFGLSAVEAAQRGIPVVISKQSGVKEVLQNSLVADFWDVDKMAHLILSSLHYHKLHKTLSHKAENELQSLTWKSQTAKMHEEYKKLSSHF